MTFSPPLELKNPTYIVELYNITAQNILSVAGMPKILQPHLCLLHTLHIRDTVSRKTGEMGGLKLSYHIH